MIMSIPNDVNLINVEKRLQQVGHDVPLDTIIDLAKFMAYINGYPREYYIGFMHAAWFVTEAILIGDQGDALDRIATTIAAAQWHDGRNTLCHWWPKTEDFIACIKDGLMERAKLIFDYVQARRDREVIQQCAGRNGI